MPNFSLTVTSLDDAKDIIETYFKSMNPEDRRDWWLNDEEHPFDKLQNLVKELMPDYNIGYLVDHQESDEDLIPYVIDDIMDTVKGKKVVDFQYADFWFEEVGHDRLYFTAIKTEE